MTLHMHAKGLIQVTARYTSFNLVYLCCGPLTLEEAPTNLTFYNPKNISRSDGEGLKPYTEILYYTLQLVCPSKFCDPNPVSLDWNPLHPNPILIHLLRLILLCICLLDVDVETRHRSIDTNVNTKTASVLFVNELRDRNSLMASGRETLSGNTSRETLSEKRYQGNTLRDYFLRRKKRRTTTTLNSLMQNHKLEMETTFTTCIRLVSFKCYLQVW